MNTKMSTKAFLHKTAALLMALMLFAALPAAPARAVSLDITSLSSGTWEATAWPDTQRSGTITVTLGDANVVGTGTAFLTELSIGNILKTAGATHTQIGTVLSITDDTHLTLSNLPVTTRTNILYTVQGVGPADNAIIANGHTVDIATNAVNQTGTVTVNTGGTLTVSNPATIFSTLIVNGTVSAADDVDFGELTVNNGGILDAAGNGAYTASALTINSGGIANISRDFSVDSQVIISGTINFSSTSVTSRAMNFLGPVTLNTGATWNEPAAGNGANNSYTFFNDFTNNATVFLASSTAAPHSFGGTGKTLNGATETAIAKVDVSGTYTNNGILTVGNLLSGTGELTNSASATLNLGGTVSINVLANAGTLNKTNGGSISTALANFTNTGTINLDSTGTITGGITNNAGGVVNITGSGAITAFDNATATSVLNIIDLTPPTITTLTVTTPGNTVKYSGDGDQTVKSTTYNNLVFSGSGNKSINLASGSTLTTGNLSIAPTGTAKASVSATNIAVDSLSLGVAGTINGTWGSTSSAATNKTDTFFASTTGYLTVATDSRSGQTINFTSTPPTNAAVGGTYIPTATATSGLTVTLSIDASSAAVCSMSSGEVTFNANGTCTINADQAGDSNYLAAPQAQQSVAVKTNQTINFTSTAPTNALVGEGSYTPTATATSGLPVVLTINASSASVCSMSGGVVSFTGAGTCVINANQPGDPSFYPAPQVQQSFAVHFKHTNVHVTMAGTEPAGSPFVLVQGTAVRKNFAGLDKGPLKVNSTNPIVPILAAEEVTFKTAAGTPTSFSKMMGLPNNQLNNAYWLPWYNNKTMSTQLQIANVSNTTATVNIWIGGRLMPGSPFTVTKGKSVSRVYLGIDQGPVRIASNVNIVVSERVTYKVNGANASFSELMALPENRLNKVYWLPWYNNKTMDTQLQISNVGASTATVRVFIGGKLAGGSFTLAQGASVVKTYPSIDKGPVKIVSTVNVLASERMVYKVNTIPVSYTEVIGLPVSQLDTTYWLPWYTKTTAIDSQLLLANASTSTATVHVYIKGTEVTGSPFTLAAGASRRLSFAGIDKGPVKIVSNVKIIAGTGMIFKVGGKATSYSEMMALPKKLLDSIYWLPWYNNKTMSTQLRIAMP